MRRPNLFVVGGPRCGTTSLHAYLKQHPQVFMSQVKEPNHFSSDIDAKTSESSLFFTPDEGEYLSLFRGAQDEKWVGESSTTYLYAPRAPGRIRGFEPLARIVISLRDPVEVMHSLHYLRVADGGEDIEDFEEALAAEEDRRAGQRLPPGSVHPGAYLYRDRVMFGEQLSRYLAVFPRDQVHVVVLDDLAVRPEETYRSLLDFLEVRNDVLPAFRVWNAARRAQSHAVQSLLRAPTARALARRATPGRLRVGAKWLTRRLHAMNELPATRPMLRPELRRVLQEQLAADVAVAGSLINRDLAALWWGAPNRGGAGLGVGNFYAKSGHG